jgi:hypothetical protein
MTLITEARDSDRPSLALMRVELRCAINALDRFEVEMEIELDANGAWPCDSASRYSKLESDVWISRYRLQKVLDADPVNDGVV